MEFSIAVFSNKKLSESCEFRESRLSDERTSGRNIIYTYNFGKIRYRIFAPNAVEELWDS
jgi:hypothetical protein